MVDKHISKVRVAAIQAAGEVQNPDEQLIIQIWDKNQQVSKSPNQVELNTENQFVPAERFMVVASPYHQYDKAAQNYRFRSAFDPRIILSRGISTLDTSIYDTLHAFYIIYY